MHRASRRLSLAAATAPFVATALVVATPGAALADESSPRPVAPQATATVDGGTRGDQRAPGFPTKALQPALDAIVAPNVPGSGVGAVAEVRGVGGGWASSSGWADLAAGARAESTDLFRGASNTKPMVSVVALQEVEAGRWTLQTTVAEVLPGLLPQAYGKVTLGQLLSHTSGMPDFAVPYATEAGDFAGILRTISQPRSNRELVAKALREKWQFAPGTKFAYSNTNYVVVGMMLEKVTGQPLARTLEKRVFGPVGMTHTFYATTPAWPARHLTDYAIADKPYPLNTFQPSFFGPAGAVTTTAADLNAFYRALVTGKLLKPATVLTMAKPPVAGSTYGLGLMAVGDPCAGPDGKPGVALGHTGASFGTMSYAFTSPDGKRQVTLAYNGRDYAKDSATFNTFLVAALQATCTTKVLTAPANPSGAPAGMATQGEAAIPVPDIMGSARHLAG